MNISKGRETILLVDDEDLIFDVVNPMLQRAGYSVLNAENGAQGIEIYERHKEQIDLVVLDMVMPDMYGGEVYDRLKEIDPDVKVLLTSGYSIQGRVAEMLERGCDGFIQKPFRLVELGEALRRILDRQPKAIKAEQNRAHQTHQT